MCLRLQSLANFSQVEGRSFDYIKDLLGRAKSTVSRELSRNKSSDGNYIPSVTNEKYLKRKSKILKGNRIRDIFTQEYIVEKLKEGWSPEQISGRLNIKYPCHYVCTETIYLLKRKTAEETRKAQVTRLGVFPISLRKTITADNGSEHVEHEKVTLAIGSKFYFATPYHSWERGINENANGLVRRYFPKKTDFKKITREEIKAVENLLNNRPRKRLGFKTPLEVFYELTKQPRAA